MAYDLERRLAGLHSDSYWHGMLCHNTAPAIAARLQRMLGERPFTFVAANSYTEDSDRYVSVEVHSSQWLTRPIVLDEDPKYFGVSFSIPQYSMGLHTSCKTEQSAHSAKTRRFNKVHLNFEGTHKLIVDHYAIAGNKLQWTFAIEDHQGFTEWSEYHR